VESRCEILPRDRSGEKHPVGVGCGRKTAGNPYTALANWLIISPSEAFLPRRAHIVHAQRRGPLRVPCHSCGFLDDKPRQNALFYRIPTLVPSMNSSARIFVSDRTGITLKCSPQPVDPVRRRSTEGSHCSIHRLGDKAGISSGRSTRLPALTHPPIVISTLVSTEIAELWRPLTLCSLILLGFLLPAGAGTGRQRLSRRRPLAQRQ